jgi:hypothetical protein
VTRGQKLMQQRIRRVGVLFREIGYRTEAAERTDESYSATFTGPNGAEGGVFIDRESRFLEIGYTFSFSPSLSQFVKERLEDIMRCAYEFGCYPNILAGKAEIVLSVFTKIYFSGITYQSLRESLIDFNRCVEAITEIVDIEGRQDDESEDPE